MADYKPDPKLVMALERALGFLAAKKPLPGPLAGELGPAVLKKLMGLLSELEAAGLAGASPERRLEALRRLMAAPKPPS